MTEVRLEEASASEHTTGWYEQRKDPAFRKQQDTKIFRAITLIALPLLWIGYFYSLYIGNDNNISGYGLPILILSFLNADVLIKGEKLENRALDILAKINCLLIFAWAVITVVLLLVK